MILKPAVDRLFFSLNAMTLNDFLHHLTFTFMMSSRRGELHLVQLPGLG